MKGRMKENRERKEWVKKERGQEWINEKDRREKNG